LLVCRKIPSLLAKMATNGNFNHQDQYKAAGDQYPSTVVSTAPIDTSEQSSTSGANHDLPKDEVGWYFVEQYYTTLSKSPEKLHVSSSYLQQLPVTFRPDV
jgi:hypothetical protein